MGLDPGRALVATHTAALNGDEPLNLLARCLTHGMLFEEAPRHEGGARKRIEEGLTFDALAAARNDRFRAFRDGFRQNHRITTEAQRHRETSFDWYSSESRCLCGKNI